MRRERGFAAVELVLVLGVAVLLGAVAFNTYNSRQANVVSEKSVPGKTTPKETAADFAKAEAQLEEVNLDAAVGGDDMTALEAELNSL